MLALDANSRTSPANLTNGLRKDLKIFWSTSDHDGVQFTGSLKLQFILPHE